MEKTFEVACGLIKFKVILNIDSLCDSVEKYKYDTDEQYEHEGPSAPIGIAEDKYNTREEHNQHVDNFIQIIKDQDNEKVLLNAISIFPKKKNGTFKKNKVLSVARLNNSYYGEEVYGWRCYELRYKSIDDTTIELQIKKVVISS